MEDIALKTQEQLATRLKLIKSKNVGLASLTLRYVTFQKQTTSYIQKVHILEAIFFCFCRNSEIELYTFL